MLDAYNGSHSVSDFSSGEIDILILQVAQLPCIGVDNSGELGLKAGKMCSAFGIVDIVTESQHVLMEFINVLERDLNLYTIGFAGY